MPGTTTDRFAEKQSLLARQRQEAAARYPQLFAEMVTAWNSPGAEDCAWLTYSANYAFRTAGVRWALDPLTLHWRVPEAPKVDASHAFDGFDFILLTHSHADHLDFDLLKALQYLPLRWVIPEYLLPRVLAAAALPADQVIVPRPLQAIDLCGIHILPFEGQHRDEYPAGSGRWHGVPATAYQVEFNGKRWLFPGDTRNYRAALPIAPGPLDGLFAHVWLGRGSALLDEPPLLDDFCQFCLNPQPERVVLAHLQEFGRDADDYWDERHARKIIARWEGIAPEIPIEVVKMGECVRL
jgi:hypothetical protein